MRTKNTRKIHLNNGTAMSKHLVWTNDSKAMEEELRKVGGRVSIIFGSSGISAIDLPAGVDVNSLSSLLPPCHP